MSGGLEMSWWDWKKVCKLKIGELKVCGTGLGVIGSHDNNYKHNMKLLVIGVKINDMAHK